MKVINGFQMLAIFAKRSILNVSQNSEYTSNKIIQN